ncbi:MAG: hypothetical protein AB7O96_14150 [Pseudobdellovibrionaceae bacterium]
MRAPLSSRGSAKKVILILSLVVASLVAISIFLFKRFGRPSYHANNQGYTAVTREMILKSIERAADYGANIILDPVSGNSRCDYFIEKKKWQLYEPAWHTGQMIYALVAAQTLFPEKNYLLKAQKAGDWWKSLQYKEGVLKGLIKADHGDDLEGFILFSTVSDGTAGLYQLSAATQDLSYAQVATEAGEFLLKKTPGTQPGLYFDNIDIRTSQVLKTVEQVRGRSGGANPYLERINIEGSLFLDAFLFSKKEEFRKAFQEQCNATVARQDANGLWMDFAPNAKEVGYIHPRFNVWHAEALIRCFETFAARKYLDSALKTAEYYARYQLPDGSLDLQARDKDKIKDRYSGSAVAFAGILWLKLSNPVIGPDFSRNINQAALWLVNHQYSEDFHIEEVRGAYKDLKIKPRQNETLSRDLGTSFGIRFLVEYYKGLK